MSIKFTDVKPMIEKKISRNNFALELVKSHKEIFNKEIEIRKLCVDTCDTKIYLIETVYLTEQLQLNEYSKDRELSISETFKAIEEMDDELMLRILDIQKKIKHQKTHTKFIIEQIEEINLTIPAEGIATNYKVIINDTIGGRCCP